MKTTGVAILAVLAAAALARPATGRAFLIDFDTDPSGSAMAAGLRIDALYGSILFSTVAGPSSHVYTNADKPAGFGSGANAISIYAPPAASAFSEARGRIRVTFESSPSSVCIAFRPDGSNHRAVMRAFDAANRQLAETVSQPGVTGNVCVSAFSIHHVEFAGYADYSGRFDNLSLVYAAGPMSGPFYLPAAANSAGVGGTTWRTDVEILNRGTLTSTVSIEWLPWNQANPSPVKQTYSLGANRAMRYENIVSSVFGASGSGTLRITGQGGSLLANARTYTTAAAGTYGQYIGALTLGDGIHPAEQGYLLHLSQSTSDSSGFRTNLGLVSATPYQIVVDASFHSRTGDLLGTKTYTLREYESRQINKVFASVTSAAVDDGYIVVSSSTAGAVFFAYASRIDNRTGDGVHIPAR